MRRRTFLQAGLGTALAVPLSAAVRKGQWDKAEQILVDATTKKQVAAATLFVEHRQTKTAKAFGQSRSVDDMYLLGSISKPISVSALMTLYDQARFDLDDRVAKFLPEFQAGERGAVTIRQLLTHVSGLPDQLPENATLRKSHAPLSEFIKGAIRTPLLFSPGEKYSYSSMGILLAVEIAQRITKTDFLKFIDKAVFQPLEMKRSALGLGRFQHQDFVRGQVEKAAVESGAGDPNAKSWDWNSLYWRKFGAPWGGLHASAPDVGRFLKEFLHPQGNLLKPKTARLMVQNHNPQGFQSRGLGFDVGSETGSPGCSADTFGHSGSTGTLAWADPATDTICVILTTLPSRAVKPHPRKLVSDQIAKAMS